MFGLPWSRNPIPSREQLAQAWYERGHPDARPINWIPWSEAPSWRKREPYNVADWIRRQLT